jgi:hypothetical protein
MEKKKVKASDSSKIAEENYQVTPDERDQNNGLAVTHEQATDSWTEGTIDGEIDDLNGKDEKLRR